MFSEMRWLWVAGGVVWGSYLCWFAGYQAGYCEAHSYLERNVISRQPDWSQTHLHRVSLEPSTSAESPAVPDERGLVVVSTPEETLGAVMR